MCCVLCAVVPSAAVNGVAAEIDTSTARLTHMAFIRHSLHALAVEILAGVDIDQRETCRLAVNEDKFDHQWVTEAFAGATAHVTDARHTIGCRVDSLRFSLVRKTRRGLFGRMRVQRELIVGLTLDYPPAMAVTGGVGPPLCRTYSGWFPAADLERFRVEEFAGLAVPPSSDFFSRWAAPAAVGTGLGVLTFLFFSVR